MKMYLIEDSNSIKANKRASNYTSLTPVVNRLHGNILSFGTGGLINNVYIMVEEVEKLEE
ncbi:hypothetical protein TSUD_102040 [Trifolium subterraneum]|uniref:Uncharacterized protein n=1 Tax=Trifolium subterraneum TaxID=3900 RepID=A0A2Z6MRR9_TRISU|nr:hypothetical protein TSUD_102040 [Trifolium subterraneum]